MGCIWEWFIKHIGKYTRPWVFVISRESRWLCSDCHVEPKDFPNFMTRRRMEKKWARNPAKSTAKIPTSEDRKKQL